MLNQVTTNTKELTPTMTTALRKPVAKKTAAPPAKKAPAKLSKPAAKKAPAAAPAASRAQERAAGMQPLDPTKDTDLSLALREMIEGGETRQHVLHRIRAKLSETTTRTGREKPTSTIMNHALNRALAHGYRIESSWRLVPQDSALQAPVAKPAKKVSKTTVAPTATEKPAQGKKVLLRKPSRG